MHSQGLHVWHMPGLLKGNVDLVLMACVQKHSLATLSQGRGALDLIDGLTRTCASHGSCISQSGIKYASLRL